MNSPSQQFMHSAASAAKAAKAGRRRRGRQSNASFSINGDDGDDDVLTTTPRNRNAAHPHVGTFSPFSHHSSQDSPRLPTQPASPSIILFSGPADRGFERVHDDTFPRDLQLLKNMARSKFRFAPAAPVEMSYVNPDGVVCDLDDEHDLRALAVHANVAQKLKVHVTSSAPAPADGPAAMPPPPAPLSSSAAFAIQPSQSDTPKRATPSTAPIPSQTNGRSTKRKRADDSPPPSAHSFSVKIPASPSAPVAKKAKGRPNKSIASEPGAPAVSEESKGPPAPAAVVPEPSASAPAASSEPAASQPAANGSISQGEAPVMTPKRGRPKKVATVEATSLPSPSIAASEASLPVPETTDSQPAANQAVVQEQPPSATPKRGRPKKITTVEATSLSAPVAVAAEPTVPIQESPASQPAANRVASQEQIPLATPKRGRAKKVAATSTTMPSQQVTEPAEEHLSVSGTAAAPTEAEPPTISAPSIETSPALDAAINVAQPAPAPAKRKAGRPSKAAIAAEAKAAAAAESLRLSRTDATHPSSAEATTVPDSAAAAPEAAPVVSEAAATPVKRKPGRPTKAAKAAAEAAAATAAAVAAAESLRLSQAEAAAASANEAQTTPAASTEIGTEESSNTPAAAATPAKKAGRQTKADKIAKTSKAGAAAAAATATPASATANPVSATPGEASSAPSAVAEGSPQDAAQECRITDNAATTTDPAQTDKATTDTAGLAAEKCVEQTVPSSSATSVPEATQEAPAAVSSSAASKRSAAGAKPRASKAAAAAAVAADECIVCGATPSHDYERCPIWQGGSQAILDLLAMIRSKSYKNKKDKEIVKILHGWLSQQFGAPSVDFTPSQDTTKSSQVTSVAPDASLPAPEAVSVAAGQADPTQEPAGDLAPAAKKQTRPKATSGKSSAASKRTLARATPDPQLPPPSGVETSPTDAAAVLVPASPPAQPAARATRGQSRKAVAAAGTKTKNKAAAQLALEPTSEPVIALTPSSPPEPSSSQSPGLSGLGLRAPSESSEDELATSPMLSAVPRSNDDMDVDEMPSQSPSRANTAEEQLAERKRRMKLADQAAADAAEHDSSARSRSASITSSDSSGGGNSSDDDSDPQSDAEATAAKASRKTTAKEQSKAASGKAQRSPAASAKEGQTAANKTARTPNSESSSSGTETESEADTTKKSTARSKSGTNGPNLKTPSASTKTSSRLSALDNPFLRGMTPAATKQSNATAGIASQKSTPFPRLSELKPATLRQNLSQPGSPLSTGGSTPLSASGQVSFFSSQPVANGNGHGEGSVSVAAAANAAAAAGAAAEAAEAANVSEDNDDDDDDDDDSSVDSSSSDDDPKKAVRRTAKGGAASTAAKRAGKRVGAVTAKPAAAKKRKNLFDVFS